MRRTYGLLAEFESVDALHRAATSLLIHGYRHVRIYAPHAVQELAGLFASPFAMLKTWMISPIVLGGGVSGAAIALFVQEYANIVSYPMNVGGRPDNSWPAFVPITFELAILGAAGGAFLAFLVLNWLPRFHHPIFNSTRFERATQDRYFICVDERDRKFDRRKTEDLLREHATAVEEVPW